MRNIRKRFAAAIAILATALMISVSPADASCDGIDIDRYNNSRGCYLK